ncbi:lytic polysaccharide monooxygenase [Patellaria atrata CBS 101060]|uniref:AA9 family lytic polysaccharide monooxygenase n=1 Tax=Patellaria atrata CBS 101060 TaxID=1346257 RepID=A0A9P4S3W7_9PEZI|nr:lytic polysaccharide monooxygenase [Patellaria atrata CBS 101060]
MKFSAAAAITSIVSLVSAHGGVGTYTMNGQSYKGWQPYNSASGQSSIQRQYGSFDPIYNSGLSSVNIRCNNNGAKGTGLTGTITAGTDMTATWTQWTHRPAAVMIYMAKCPGACNSWDGSGNVWFKVDHAGLKSGTLNKGIWAGDQIVDTLKWTFKVPASLAPGEYLVRHELLALHQGGNPQFYPECAQVTVTGSGSAQPSGSYLVSFPGAYKASDPGIAVNIDSASSMTSTEYIIPGPAVWTG